MSASFTTEGGAALSINCNCSGIGVSALKTFTCAQAPAARTIHTIASRIRYLHRQDDKRKGWHAKARVIKEFVLTFRESAMKSKRPPSPAAS